MGTCGGWKEPFLTHTDESKFSVYLLGARRSKEAEWFGFFYLVAGYSRPPRELRRILFFMVIIFNLFACFT